MGTVTLDDGRTVGYAEFGRPVLWCHGGPGNRLEPEAFAPDATEHGLRIVVAGYLDLPRFAVVGCSTGGAYALAIARVHPERVDALVACCTLTDMSWPEGRAMMTGTSGIGRATAGIWDAPDRAAALISAEEVFGADGFGMLILSADGPPMPAADVALFTDPVIIPILVNGMRESFTFGVQGYVDDGIADGAGWTTFDVSAVVCPAVVLHGAADSIVPVEQARHTANLISSATLRILPELGHFSIIREVMPTLGSLLDGD